MKGLNTEEKISFICKNELKISSAVFNGHQPTIDDEFSETRKLINQYRIELGILKPACNKKKY